MAKERWMGKVAAKIKSSGHEGVFSGAAHKAGKTTAEFAKEHEHSPGKIGKRARLAEAFAKKRR